MKSKLYRAAGILFVIAGAALQSAPLSIEGPVEDFFAAPSMYTADKTFRQPDERMLDTSLVSPRPPVYEVSYRQLSADDIERMAEAAGVVDSLKQFAGYDEKRGVCHFHSPHLVPLADESAAGLAELDLKGKAMLEKMMGKRSRLFVFANRETDWVLSAPDTVPRRVMYTCRFTRKVNGSHIIGNVAYARISFTGKGEMCGFEIADPDLQPFQVKRMVKPSATRYRLQQFAASKNRAVSTMNDEVPVASITAAKGVRSYVLRTAGALKQLVPCISILCRYRLSNGAAYEKFEHFVVDAAHVSNIDESMLEPSGR